jgi:hypothetical protein
MNVEIGTEAAYPFWEYLFEFSVLCLCSVMYTGYSVFTYTKPFTAKFWMA